MSIQQQAAFGVGQLVRHRLFEYRGVIADVDPEFNLSEAWYRKMATTQPPRDRPWYRVLVDGAEHETYVAERNLEIDESREPVSHPAVEQIFEAFQDGGYQPRGRPM